MTLALSLHAPNDEIRKQLMPVAYKYKLEDMTTSLKSGPFSTPIGTTSDGKFISLLRTGQLMGMKAEGQKFVKELEGLIAQSEEDDNPILLLLKEQ